MMLFRIAVLLYTLYRFGLEELFYNYGVDLEIWAHEHSYERLWPLFNHTVLNGSTQEPYHNPRGPVHIITGSAVITFFIKHVYCMHSLWLAYC